MRTVVLGAFLFLSGSAAFATGTPQAPPPMAPRAPQNSCVEDAKRFCEGVPYGEGRRIACLERHTKQLTPACQKFVPKVRALFEFGKKQHELVMEAIAREKAAADKAASTKKAGTPPQH